ncbi:MAG: hypothetical protein RL557_958 [archaeon]|jgi:hypothetical protein
MKRGMQVFFCFVICGVFLISFVSAGLFDWFFENDDSHNLEGELASLSGTVDNLLPNGDAETGNVNGWNTRWGKGIGLSNEAYAGSYSFLREGYEQIESDFIAIDPTTEYYQEGWFKSGSGNSKFYYGFIPYDKDKKEIARQYVYYYSGSETELYADIVASDKIIKIKDGSKWQVFKYGVVAFNVDNSGNYADLPNFDLSNHDIIRVESKGDYWEVEFNTNVGKDAPAGTKIREHRFGGTYMYNSANGLSVPTSWTKYSATLTGECATGTCDGQGKWWKGTRYVKVLIIANYGQNADYKLFFDDLILEGPGEESDTDDTSEDTHEEDANSDSCTQLIEDITALLNAHEGQQICGDAEYDAVLDIDNDGYIVSQDLLLVINKLNAEDYSFCEEQLTDDSDPCDDGIAGTCTDTDGGRDYFVKGTVTDEDGSMRVDHCSEKNLLENYCPGDGALDSSTYENFGCPYGCSDGACNTCGEESKEISEGSTETVNNVNIRVITVKSNSNPTNSLFATLLLEPTSVELSSEHIMETVYVAGKTYEIQIDSVSDNSAVILVAEESRGIKSREFLESESLELAGLEIAVEEVSETDSGFIVKLLVGEEITLIDGVLNFKFYDSVRANGAMITVSLVSSSNNVAKIAVNGCIEEYSDICTDSDGGGDVYVKGIVSDENGMRTDTCLDESRIQEEWCYDDYIATYGGASPSDVHSVIQTYSCPEGCSDGACIDRCPDGCLLDDTCYDFGHVIDGKFCFEDGAFVEQFGGGRVCENDFECGSNLCTDGQCVSEGLFKRFLKWLRRN